jgi:8-oxo-dGTP diphosphatase
MREIASTLLFDTAGRFLFQQRDNIAGITEPGKIGLFGGHKEGNETFLECIAREVQRKSASITVGEISAPYCL